MPRFSSIWAVKRPVIVTAIVLGEVLLLFAFMELGLRGLGRGHSTRPFVKIQHGHASWHVLNDRYYGQFINTAAISRRYTYPNATTVRVPKAHDVFRIVVFGGSAAYGWSFEEFSMGRILQSMLSERYPEFDFEVITVAYHAMNSFTMRYLAEACETLEPDLFLVYMGNNEMVGPYGLQSVLGSKSRSPRFVQLVARMNLWLSDLRLFQLFGIPARELFSKSVDHLVWGGYAGVNAIDDPRLERIYETFRDNLERICGAADRAGAHTLLCTVGYNLRDWPPTLSGHRITLSTMNKREWEDHYQRGNLHKHHGEPERAIPYFEQAAAIDNTYAELMYALAQCHQENGNYLRARECYQLAAENSLSFASANMRINAIIRETAASRKNKAVCLVDAEAALNAHSRYGIAGREYFYDHVHLTFEGNFRIACTVSAAIDDLLVNRRRVNSQTVPDPVSMGRIKEMLGYSPGLRLQELRTVESILGAFPENPALPEFRAQLVVLEKQMGADPELFIAEGYRQAALLNPKDTRVRYRYVDHLQSVGQTVDTLEDARFLVEREPCNWEYRAALIRALIHFDPEEAYQHNLKLLQLYPGYAGIHALAGNTMLATDDPPKAVTHFEQATTLEKDNVSFHRALAHALARSGNFMRAEIAAREAIGLAPEQTTEIIGELESAVTQHEMTDNWALVVEGCRAIARLEPECATIRSRLIIALCELHHYTQAWEVVEECRNRAIDITREALYCLEAGPKQDAALSSELEWTPRKIN